jgi:hypothetical protein
MRYLSDSAKRAEIRHVSILLAVLVAIAGISLAAIFTTSTTFEATFKEPFDKLSDTHSDTHLDKSFDTHSDKSLTRQAICQTLCEKGVVHHHHLKQTRLNRCITQKN